MLNLNINNIKHKFQKNGIVALEDFINQIEVDELKNIVKVQFCMAKFSCSPKTRKYCLYPKYKQKKIPSESET